MYHTLLLVPNVHWIVIEDGKIANYDDIVKCGEDVAGIGHSLMYARAIVTQLPVVKDA